MKMIMRVCAIGAVGSMFTGIAAIILGAIYVLSMGNQYPPIFVCWAIGVSMAIEAVCVAVVLGGFIMESL